MSATNDHVKETQLTFRRYRDGDEEYDSYQDKIFQASWSHKCPTYQASTPPCQGSCPAGEDIRGYLSIVRGIEKPPAGMAWQEYAFRRMTDANPFPSIMGRVCPAPCESGCNRNEVDDHVGINSVEHYIGEWALANNLQFEKPASLSGKRVAIIGGGPAGLAAAYHLTRKGHQCTIFEERPLLGGMLRYGIPGFRTPREVLDAEIQRIVDMGVEVHLNTRIGRDISYDQIEKDFDAIFVGLGAQGGRSLPIPGANAPNVVTAVAFLRAFNDGRLQHVGKKVVVIGGGDVSVDVATVAKRLGHITKENPKDHPEHVISGHTAHDVAAVSARQGAEVTLTAVMAREKLEANKHEIDHALSEGITLLPGTAPIEVVLGPDGRAIGLKVADCEATLKGGRLEIKVKEGTERVLEADLVVSAIGQAVDWEGLEALNPEGKPLMQADKNYRVPGKAKVFAGGDVIRPHLITTAVGHAAIAADGIDAFLRSEEAEKRPKIDVHHFDLMRKLVEQGLNPDGSIREATRGTDTSKGAVHNFDDRSYRYVIPHDEIFLGHFTYVERNQRDVTMVKADEVLGHFEERIQALVEEKCVAEAKRCMSCGMCFECDNCVIFCPQTAVGRVPKKEATLGRYVYTDYNKCIGCHICSDVCPTGYIQMGLGE